MHVERVLMEHPKIKEVAVCGVDDLTWGQKVGAVVSLEDSSQTLELEEVSMENTKGNISHYTICFRKAKLDTCHLNNKLCVVDLSILQ